MCLAYGSGLAVSLRVLDLNHGGGQKGFLTGIASGLCARHFSALRPMYGSQRTSPGVGRFLSARGGEKNGLLLDPEFDRVFAFTDGCDGEFDGFAGVECGERFIEREIVDGFVWETITEPEGEFEDLLVRDGIRQEHGILSGWGMTGESAPVENSCPQ